MDADGSVDLFVELLAPGHVLRREPAADALRLQIGVKALSELLILCREADEQGVELDAHSDKGRYVIDELFGNAGPAQKCTRNPALGQIDRVNTDGGREVM